jgi:hypothetical protein
VAVSAADPELVVTAPDHLRDSAREIEALVSVGAFDEALLLTGRSSFGEPIRVVLLDESSPAVQELPAWVSGYARADRRLVAIIPSRVPSYPDRNLAALMVHEVAHILVADATGGRPVPRWFNEGIATVAAREWGLEDHARYAAAAAGRRVGTVEELDRGFRGGGSEARRSYALSAAFIRWLRTEVDSDVTARILDRVDRGEPFDAAFLHATGMNLASAESGFLHRRWLWATWVPFLTSAGALWMAITVLALVAIARRTVKNRDLRRRWDAEEADAIRYRVGPTEPGRTAGGDLIN